jgi:hypothetical protein
MWSKRPSPALPDPEPPQVTPGLLEARQARQHATGGLMAAIGRGPEVREVVRQIDDHGRRNHFFDLLDETLPWSPRR